MPAQPQPEKIQKGYPMSFERFNLVNLYFMVNPGFKKAKTVEMRPSLEVANKYDEKNKTLDIRIKVSLSDGNTPFTFTIVGEGRFIFKAAPDEQTLTNVANINGPAIIYPYVRETIADLTRRAGFTPLHLQPVNFIKFSKKAADAKTLLEKGKKP